LTTKTTKTKPHKTQPQSQPGEEKLRLESLFAGEGGAGGRRQRQVLSLTVEANNSLMLETEKGRSRITEGTREVETQRGRRSEVDSLLAFGAGGQRQAL